MITVLAATGFTGQLISHELARRGLEFQIAGRSAEKLRALANSLGRPKLRTHVLDVLRAETYSSALERARVLINCAGPFTDLGIGIVRAAAERGIHYIDTTGEQHFIKRVYDQCHAIAEQQGCALIPACAFEYALGDAGAALAARGLTECDEINIYYAIGSFGASRGTKKSIVRAITSPAYLYRNGQLVEVPPAAEQRLIEFPKIGQRNVVSFGGGEVLSVPRHVRARAVSTFMSMDGAAPWMLNLVSAALKTPLSKLVFRWIESQAVGPNEQDRKRSLFTILCQAKSAQKLQQVTVTGQDPYGLTAIISAETAAKLLSADKDISGATSAARAFGPEMIQSVTEAAGVKWKLA